MNFKSIPNKYEYLSWPDIKEIADNKRSTIIWPFGAVEQHGPHLPLATDSIFVDEILSEVLKSELSENSIFVINHGNINKSGIAFYNDSFYLTDFIEKPNNLSVMNRESFGINIGLYFFNDFSCLENTENKKIFDFGIDIFPRLVTENIPIKVEMIKSLEYPIFIDDIERIRKTKR